MMIDLRSDTVTRPSREMLEAMFSARVGDDVFGDDPTVIALEEHAAAMFGKEAALFCPSGTMTNQVAINVHTRPGDEVICHKFSHVYYYEGGAIMRNSGASVCLLDGPRGQITAGEVETHINPDDIHRPVTSLVEAENTMNKGGGTIYKYADLEAISEVCRRHGLKFHLDGARLFNALAETGEKPGIYGRLFDSVSICLSKGLGAPVGSLLLGEKSFIRKARRVRKAFGGAMRQAGYLAAAGLYALEHNVGRLKMDNDRARHLGGLLATHPLVESVIPVETNIVIFTLKKKNGAMDFLARLKEHDIHAITIDPQTVRFVTHLDFSDSMLSQTESVLKTL
ncbi:MAG: aminotransferase class I/II-fold pyridoxal phosphate-dependent enzyme [Bacteroidetes bacterium]|nr:aminotransferase class I/II-fold pyridoxal phosphate-dependent enzyme [Bacteroidota bacterium]